MIKNNTLFVFSGQGSQHVGMAADFMDAPETKELFEQADDTLNMHLSALMREGDVQTLQQTENTQPALLLSGIAALTYFLKQAGKPLVDVCQYMAGHSLGEYTALTAAGSFIFEDALKLVRLRGEAMNKATTQNKGTMAAVLGVEADILEKVILRSNCFIANDNAPGQQVISGKFAHIESAIDLISEAKRVVPLKVAGAFHTPYMEPAAIAIQKALESIVIIEPTVPVILNVTAQPETSAVDIKKYIVTQICTGVRWRETMTYAAENGITQVIEFGAGQVLAKLAKRNRPELNGLALNSRKNIDTFLATQ